MGILVIQPGALGDLVLSLPAIRAVREAFGRQGMEIWAERANLSLLDHPDYADSVRPLAETGLDSYPLPYRTLEAIGAFDMVISWRGARFPELVEAVRQVQPRVFFLPQLPPPESAMHLAEFRRSQLIAVFGEKMAASSALDADPALPLTDADREFACEYLSGGDPAAPVAVIHPGASGKVKQWAPEGFAGIAQHLVRNWEMRVLLSEGPLDQQAVESVLGAVSGSGISRMRIENLRQVAAVLDQADLFIGNDTGIAHLAAAVGAPSVVIFQSSDPHLWAPRGKRVRVLVKPSLEETIQAAENILSQRGTNVR